jgi:hypothetical protein
MRPALCVPVQRTDQGVHLSASRNHSPGRRHHRQLQAAGEKSPVRCRGRGSSTRWMTPSSSLAVSSVQARAQRAHPHISALLHRNRAPACFSPRGKKCRQRAALAQLQTAADQPGPARRASILRRRPTSPWKFHAGVCRLRMGRTNPARQCIPFRRAVRMQAAARPSPVARRPSSVPPPNFEADYSERLVPKRNLSRAASSAAHPTRQSVGPGALRTQCAVLCARASR